MKKHHLMVKDYAAKFAHLKGKRILFGVSWKNGVHIHTLKGYVPSLLKELGLNYSLTDTTFKKASEKINLEQLLAINPDILIVARRKDQVLFDQWLKSPLINQIKAIKNNQLYFVEQNLWTRLRGITATKYILEDLWKLAKN
jgi:iron complex transport system substrate-binding protein